MKKLLILLLFVISSTATKAQKRIWAESPSVVIAEANGSSPITQNVSTIRIEEGSTRLRIFSSNNLIADLLPAEVLDRNGNPYATTVAQTGSALRNALRLSVIQAGEKSYQDATGINVSNSGYQSPIFSIIEGSNLVVVVEVTAKTGSSNMELAIQSSNDGSSWTNLGIIRAPSVGLFSGSYPVEGTMIRYSTTVYGANYTFSVSRKMTTNNNPFTKKRGNYSIITQNLNSSNPTFVGSSENGEVINRNYFRLFNNSNFNLKYYVGSGVVGPSNGVFLPPLSSVVIQGEILTTGRVSVMGVFGQEYSYIEY